MQKRKSTWALIGLFTALAACGVGLTYGLIPKYRGIRCGNWYIHFSHVDPCFTGKQFYWKVRSGPDGSPKYSETGSGGASSDAGGHVQGVGNH